MSDDPSPGLPLTPVIPLTLFVLSHKPDVLEKVPPLPFLQKVLLGNLEVDPLQPISGLSEGQDPRFGEGRAFLTELQVQRESEYVGYLNGRSQEKYHWLKFTWEGLAERISGRLSPEKVLSMWCGPADWAAFSERMHPGMLPVLEEISEYTSIPLIGGSTLWANDFICHREVWRDWLDFWRRTTSWIVGKWGLDPPTPQTNCDHNRRLAYLLERVTCLYFSSRKDLVIEQL